MVYALGAAVIAAALIWITSQQRGAALVVERDTASMAVATDIQLDVLTFNRISNLLLASRDPEHETTRASIEAQVRRSIARAQELSGSRRESELVSNVASNFDAYLQRRSQLEAAGMGLAEVIAEVRPSLDEVVASIETLRAVNESQVELALAETTRLDRTANVLGIVAGFLLVTLVFVGVTSMRLFIVRPLLGVRDALDRFRNGDVDVEAPGRGPTEVRTIGLAFNEMRRELIQQRRGQLAFLAGVAHDLRNPLFTAKMGMHAVLKDLRAAQNARVVRKIEILDRQLDHVSRMVGDLLDATRIEAGELELQLEEMDLRRVAQSVVELYEPISPRHALAMDLPDAPIVVRGDMLRLEQVVSNLVNNGIKYSPAGGPVHVVVGATGNRALLAVSDRGIGIPKNELTDIFMPFRRRTVARHVAPGVGLGLSVVRRIVHAHGGEIEVESVPGEGSTFRIRLPIVVRRTDAPGAIFDERMAPAGDRQA